MSSCDYEKCFKQVTGSKYITCNYCSVMKYCSEKCRDLDRFFFVESFSNVFLNS